MHTPIGNDVASVIAHSDQGDPIYRRGGKVPPPKLLEQHEPEFSALARAFHYEGTTILSVTVNESGSPEDIQVLRPAGFGLDDSAVQAVKTWRFDPAKLDGNPVKTAIDVEVGYRFRP
jgi:protein TonB